MPIDANECLKSIAMLALHCIAERFGVWNTELKKTGSFNSLFLNEESKFTYTTNIIEFSFHNIP